MMCKLLLIGLLSAVLISASPTKTFSQSDLAVEGNVLGYELVEFNEIKLFGCCFIWINYEYPALIKISKVTKGKEKSQYIIVLLKTLNKDYAEKNFGIDKTTNFKLVRRTNYFLKPKDLLRTGDILKNGKSEKFQKFTFVPEINKKDLPLNKKLPVYVEIERSS